jgi:hypothetical protein
VQGTKISTLTATAAATLASAAVFAVPAAAASMHARAAPVQRIRHGVSTNWAGYVILGSGPYGTISAKWTQPAVECAATPTAYSAFWVGLDGDGSKTVEQTGTEANCSGGGAAYGAWYEMYPKRSVSYAEPVLPGDEFSASVTALSKGRFQLTLSDATQGWSQTTVQKRKSAKRVSAEVIAEAPSTRKGVLPLADFGTIGFSGASLEGSPLTSSTPGIEPLTMASGSTVKASPSSISGGSFSVTWQHE